MTALRWLAWLVLIVELPVPIYWLIFHGGIGFWRGRGRLVYAAAVGCAWGIGGWLLYHFRAELWPPVDRPLWAIVAGALLMGADIAVLFTVEKQLGGRRLVGQAELAGDGELSGSGLYGLVRHPRYLGMILGVLGVCMLAGSRTLWIVAGAWFAATLFIIQMEERELGRRFGAAHAAYKRRVPALAPRRFWIRKRE
jgi:protein-S-isoprenylcysteine O-methyltransferase Ste14